ncbi:MAG: DUF4342 domain-containing protein [Oscillospiraceae bacterium]|nr:DUF4342 domain-containing protein [Oscillospiraceae bacterium]
MDKNSIIEKVKELVRKGNVSRILVKQGDKEIVNIPVNVGIIGGVVALAYAKVLLLGAALATIGFGCTVEVIKDDGQVVEVVKEGDGEKVRNAAANVVGEVKNAFTPKSDESAFEDAVAAEEPTEEKSDEE